MRFLDEHDVRSVFDIDTAIASQRAAFIALARGEAWQPEKILGGHPDDPDTVFCYASRLDRTSGPVCKFGSINPGNAGTGRPTVHAVVAVLDPDTGVPVTFMDGTALTTLRTAAASAVVVEALAGKDATRLLVLGSGVQGRAHVAALRRNRNYAWTGMWSPRRSSVETSVARLREQGFDVEPVAESLGDAIARADVIVCATLATEPLFTARQLGPGATVVAIGSFDRHRCEVGPDILRASHHVVVDHEPTARENCGPVIAAQADTAADLELLELGHVLTGVQIARGGDDDIVTYLSSGLGVQDAAAAWSVHRHAEAHGTGLSLNQPTPPSCSP